MQADLNSLDHKLSQPQAFTTSFHNKKGCFPQPVPTGHKQTMPARAVLLLTNPSCKLL